VAMRNMREKWEYVVTTPEGGRAAFALPNGVAIPIHPIIAQLPFEFQEGYAQLYADAWAEALNKQGMAAFDASKASAAIHEAGHLAIAALDGFVPIYGRIWRLPVTKNWVGWTQREDKKNPVGPGALALGNLLCARTVMAGYVAESVFEGESAREGSSLDERVAAFFIASWTALDRPTSDLIDEIEQSVGEALMKHEDTVRKLARALIGASPLKLKGKRLEALLEPLRQAEVAQQSKEAA
jgi:hypothetical protein